jgi:hypothetical protein
MLMYEVVRRVKEVVISKMSDMAYKALGTSRTVVRRVLT